MSANKIAMLISSKRKNCLLLLCVTYVSFLSASQLSFGNNLPQTFHFPLRMVGAHNHTSDEPKLSNNNHTVNDTRNTSVALSTTTPTSSNEPLSNPNITVASGPFVHLRTLVIVQGALRGGEIPWKTLKRNVLDYNPNTDLALLVGEPPLQYKNSSLIQWAKYTWKFPEYDDWGVVIDETFGDGWRHTILPRLPKRSNIMGATKEFPQGSGAVNFMIRYWLREKLLEHRLVEKYDQFVITRSDHYYLCPHDLSQFDTSKYMYVPEGSDYRGICDRHLVIGNDQIVQALDWFPHLAKHYEEYPLSRQAGTTELMLKTHWELIGLFPKVKRFDRNMFICVADGDSSRTPHTKDIFGPEGVQLKYPFEYATSLKTCEPFLDIPPEKKAALEKTRSELCEDCSWTAGVTCLMRAEHLQRKYGVPELEALKTIMEVPSCRRLESI